VSGVDTHSARVDNVLSAAYEAGELADEHGERRELFPSGVDRRQGEGLRNLVVSEGATQTLEVGFALGLSCLHMCSGLLRNGAAEPRHVAIDHTEAEYWGNVGRLLVERAGLADLVELIELPSQVALPRLQLEGRRFDLAFVDGDHRFDPAFVDLYFTTKLVRPGGLIIVDDMWMPALRVAVAYFEANLGLELLPDAMPDGFRWRWRPFSREIRPGRGHTAVLRMPPEPDTRPWDHFVDFRR
jgi:predicted O-methyltransferase YrrM